VSGNGAFEDEMDFLRRTRQPDDELAAFAQAVRSTLVEPANPATAALLVPRLAETARASAPTRPAAPTALTVRPRRRWVTVVRVAVAVAAIPILLGGIAFAGVRLPGPADSVFETVGVELPNQAADHESAESSESSDDSVSDQSVGSEPGAKGKGSAAEQRGHGKEKSNKARDLGRGHGAQGKGRALGKRGLAPGNANGQVKSKGAGGGGGGGYGNGGTESVPPGQATKDYFPGNSGIPSGKAKGLSK
jgi:hypothetical protein